MPTTTVIADTDLRSADTDCCAHFVRDGLTVTYPDSCTAWWDADGFTFTHAHPDREAVITFESD